MSTPSRKTMEISLGVLFLATLCVLAYLALRMGTLTGFGDVKHVFVRFEDASGLVEDAAVKVAGVNVGKVKKLDVDFDSAVAQLELRSDADIRRDAIASIRARSLLGEKYVELKPQSRDAQLATSGDFLTAAPQGLEIEQLAAELGPIIKDLQLEKLSSQAQNVLAMLEKQDEPLDEMVKRINRILIEVESLPLDDPNLHRDVKESLASLRQASADLPGLAEKLDGLLVRGDGLIQDLEPTVQKLNASAQDLPEMVSEADIALQRINRLLEILEPQAKRLQDLDYSMIQHVFREEGLLLRFAPREVPEFDPEYDATPYPLSPIERPGTTLSPEGAPMSANP